MALLLKLYKSFGKDPKVLVNSCDLNGISPLMLACYLGDVSLVQMLLDNGADPLMASTKNNVTVLHVCAERGFVEIAKLILRKYPSLVFEVESEKGNSALHVATEWDYIELVKMFTELGGRQLSVELKNKKGYSVIDTAYKNNTQESYSYLCKKFKVKEKCLFCALF